MQQSSGAASGAASSGEGFRCHVTSYVFNGWLFTLFAERVGHAPPSAQAYPSGDYTGRLIPARRRSPRPNKIPDAAAYEEPEDERHPSRKLGMRIRCVRQCDNTDVIVEPRPVRSRSRSRSAQSHPNRRYGTCWICEIKEGIMFTSNMCVCEECWTKVPKGERDEMWNRHNKG